MSSRFYQDEVWVDAQGVEHKIKKMDPGHVKNVIAMLRRNAEDLALRESLQAYSGVAMLNGEMAIDSVERMADEIAEDPHRWLESTPLMRELVRVDIRNERRIARRYDLEIPGCGRKERKEIWDDGWETGSAYATACEYPNSGNPNRWAKSTNPHNRRKHVK